jgi:hypothetical protein
LLKTNMNGLESLNRDKKIWQAIENAQSTLSTVRDLVANGVSPAQSHVTVVSYRQGKTGLVPFGVSVSSINETTVRGKLVENLDEYSVSTVEAELKIDEVIDWYYYDSFEMIGGFLFKELLERTPERAKNQVLRCHRLALIRTPQPLTEEERRFAQLVFNERINELDKVISTKPQLVDKTVRHSRVAWGRQGAAFIVTSPFREFAVCTGSRLFLEELNKRKWLVAMQGAKMPLIHIASAAGNFEAVEYLLERGDNPMERDSSRRTALYCAVEFGNATIASLLLSRGSNPNVADNGGYSVLHRVDNLEIAKELVQYGADINAVSESGYSVVESLAEEGKMDIVKYLLDLGATSKPRLKAIAESYVPPEEVRKRFSPYLYGETEVKDSQGKLHIPSAINYGSVLPVRMLVPLEF